MSNLALKISLFNAGVKMMHAIRTILCLCFLVIPAAAAGDGYEALETRDFRRPEACQGRLVEVTAEVVSVSVDSKTLHLYDAQSKALIGVSLSKLTIEERRALILNPVHRISVYGRVDVKNGRLVIEADRVEPQNSQSGTGIALNSAEGNLKGAQQ